MSASREKRSRKETVNTAAAQQAAEQKAKTRKNVLIGVAIALVVVLIIGPIVLFKGPYFRTHSVAVTTGTHELSPATVRYYYADAFNSFTQGYGQLISYMFEDLNNIQDEIYDPETGATWGDYLMDTAVDQIARDYAVYDEAIANGYVLSEEGEAALSQSESYVEMYSQLYGTTPDAYIRSVYGAGSSLASYLDYQRVKYTAYYYGETVREGFTYGDAELRAADDEAPNDYSYYNYHSYLVSGYSDSEDEAEKAAAMETAKERAEKMAEDSANDLDTYLAYCNEYSGSDTYTDGTASLRKNFTTESMTDDVEAWVTDPARAEGDTTVIEVEDSGYYVLYYLSASDNNYDALRARVIKISALVTDDAGAESTDWDAAKEKLDALQAEFDESTDDLETKFQNLAATYSDDADTKYTGGLYEHIYRGQFDDAVSEWLFDGSRTDGETAVVEGADAYYFLCYEGTDGNYRDYLIENVLREADYDAWYADVTADASAERNDFGMSHVNMTLNATTSSN